MPQNSMVFEPLQGLIQGVVQGHQIHQMMMNAALQQEAEQRRAFQQDRDNKIEDIGIQQKLQSSAQPVDQAGMVTETGTFPAVGDVIGKMSQDTPYQLTRKADRSRTIKYGEREYELKTPEQQQADQLRQLKKRKDVENASDFDKLRGEEAIREPYRAGARQDIADRNDADNARARDVANIAATRAETVAAENRKATKANTDANIASREKIAAGKAATAKKTAYDTQTANQKALEIDKAQKQVNAWQDEEQKLWTANTRLQSLVQSGKSSDDKGNEITLNEIQKSQMRQTSDANKKKIDQLQARQRQTVAKYGGDAGPGGSDPGGVRELLKKTGKK